MVSLNIVRRLFSGQTKEFLSAKFPKLKRAYNRKLVLNTIGLKRYYNKEKDALVFGKSVLPMKLFYEPRLSGWLNSEFIDIVCPLIPDGVYKKLPYLEGPYELGDVKIEKGDVVFDFGARMGLFSIMTANFDCLCYAFEPMPSNIIWLKELVQINPHIKIAPYAVSDQNGNAWFDNYDATSVFGKISESNEKNNKFKVDCITIDSFVEQNNISRVDFIKADIEGAERLLLKGATRVLKEFSPKISICKYHLPDDPEVLVDLILKANPNYIIEEKYMKIYAYVPKQEKTTE